MVLIVGQLSVQCGFPAGNAYGINKSFPASQKTQEVFNIDPLPACRYSVVLGCFILKMQKLRVMAIAAPKIASTEEDDGGCFFRVIYQR